MGEDWVQKAASAKGRAALALLAGSLLLTYGTTSHTSSSSKGCVQGDSSQTHSGDQCLFLDFLDIVSLFSQTRTETITQHFMSCRGEMAVGRVHD